MIDDRDDGMGSIDLFADDTADEDIQELNQRFMVDGVCCCPLRKSIEKWGIGGSAVTDASRVIARLGLTDYLLRIEFPGGRTQEIQPLSTRSIKEAMVTVGGVSLKDVNSRKW